MRRTLPLLLATIGCSAPTEIEPGRETGACLEGECFDGLECLSDLCVGPDAEPTQTGGDDGSSASGASGASATASASGASASATASDPSGGPSSADESGSDPSAASSDPDGGDEDPSTDDGAPVSWGSCDQLDVLFIVDNSASMLDEQGTLAASAPAFLDDLVERSGSSDHHVMVVDTDAWVFGNCEQLCSFGVGCTGWEDYVCGETQPLQCEDVLGAGVTHPRGVDASNTGCGFQNGSRYLTLSEPDAAERFVCAATVGTGSTVDPEVPMEAMVTAINPVAGGAAADCNEGFLRGSAPLVVVFVTDEDDAEGDSSGTPEGWRQGLAAAKGGDTDRVAVLGLFGDNDQPGAICGPLGDSAGAEPSVRLREFVELFDDRGLQSSVCAADYGGAFADLLDVLDAMCE